MRGGLPVDSGMGVFTNVDLEEEKEEEAERVRKRWCSGGVEEVVGWSKEERLAHPFDLSVGQKEKQTWPISDDNHLHQEAARLSLTPPLLPRGTPPNNHTHKSGAIPSLTAKSTAKLSSLKQLLSFPSCVVSDIK